jgi:large subunit ribosomal protein L3
MASTFRGLLGEKLGMTQVFDENNRIVPVTVVKAGPCVVTQVRTPERDGYSALQLGFGAIDPRKVNKPEGGHFTAGVMKRHGFKGLGAGHGTHRKHRAPGSIGGASTPGRVFKGVRMAGRMGAVTTTTLSLTVHKVDAEKGLLLIKGAVPGPRGGLLLVRSAVKGGPVGSDEK